MSYLSFSEFRTDTIAEYCQNVSLTEAEASDSNLTAAIARFSQRFDDLTNDHYEAELVSLSLSGDNTPRLRLPKRCTAVSDVSLIDTTGSSTSQDSSVYRLRSSLYSAGSKRIGHDELDYLELIYGAGGLTGYPTSHWNPYTWPCDTNSVSVTGSFGWTTTPGDVKRAVALMVYDHFKPMDSSLRRTQSFTTENAAYNLSISAPTGIPEADAIITDFKYGSPFVGIG